MSIAMSLSTTARLFEIFAGLYVNCYPSFQRSISNTTTNLPLGPRTQQQSATLDVEMLQLLYTVGLPLGQRQQS